MSGEFAASLSRIARFVAVAIVLIVACGASSAAWAHDGRAHDLVRPLTVDLAQPAQSSTLDRSAEIGDRAGDVLRAAPDCATGQCLGACCGHMACCAVGILSAPPALPARAARAVALPSRQAMCAAGLGPEAPSEPPRPFA